MSKLKIKNFGPIKEGLQEKDGWLDLKKFTIFIGNQGSGKSTVAKLISTLTWIEKALVRGDFKEKDICVYNRFVRHCSYQNIHDYFKPNTRIEYVGKAYSILYESGNVSVNRTMDNGYSFPKIMYVPSERNLVSSVKNVRSLKGLPSSLYAFSDEFIDAIESLKGHIDLPINNAKFEYQNLNRLSWIIGDDFKIKLSEASSGFQSSVPLFIVTKNLSQSLEKETDPSVKKISIEDGKKIKEEIKKIYSNPNLSEEVKKASLEYLSSRFKYASFINIVEEPEQNLFPSSQRHILNKLLEFTNLKEENKMIITTHSPYIINYLTLCVKASTVYDVLKEKKIRQNDTGMAQTNAIVPFLSSVSSGNLIIYELNEVDGSIKKLADYKGLPSDENQLNSNLEDTNELFAQLQEIERGWR